MIFLVFPPGTAALFGDGAARPVGAGVRPKNLAAPAAADAGRTP